MVREYFRRRLLVVKVFIVECGGSSIIRVCELALEKTYQHKIHKE